MRYAFGVRQNTCEGWFEGIARPVGGGPERTSRRFNTQAGAVDAVRYFMRNGQFRREEEEAAEVEEIAICEACGQPLPKVGG